MAAQGAPGLEKITASSSLVWRAGDGGTRPPVPFRRATPGQPRSHTPWPNRSPSGSTAHPPTLGASAQAPRHPAARDCLAAKPQLRCCAVSASGGCRGKPGEGGRCSPARPETRSAPGLLGAPGTGCPKPETVRMPC